MKTLEKVQSEISALQKEADTPNLPKKDYKKIEKKVKLLYQCQLYLETNPTAEFLEKQKEDLKKKLKAIDAGFLQWSSNNPQEANSVKNPKSKYNSIMGTKNFKAQLLTLQYLIVG